MAVADEDDVLDTDIPTGEAEAPAEGLTDAEPPPGDEDEDEVLVSFEGEGAPAQGEEQDSSVIRRLREENRKKDAELRALRATQAPQPQVIEVGEKPTLAACEYDEEAFERELDAWKDRGAKAKEAETQAQRAQQQQQEEWQQEVSTLEAQEKALMVVAKDYPQAKAEAEAALNPMQQATLAWAAKDKAKVIFALGKHPQKLADLAKITHPIKFAVAVADLEGKLTVTTQRKAPPPEQIVRGSAPLSAPRDKELERLEKDAERTGDRTKVVQYKRQQKTQAK